MEVPVAALNAIIPTHPYHKVSLLVDTNYGAFQTTRDAATANWCPRVNSIYSAAVNIGDSGRIKK